MANRSISRSLIDILRKHDYANFLQVTFYPEPLKTPYLALRAFNVQIASLRETVSQETLGKLRTQWWREAISSIYTDKPVEHPVVLGLHEANNITKLSKHHLQRVIDAREQNLESPSFNTLDDIRNYSQRTHFSLLSLQLQLINALATKQDKHKNLPSLSTLDHALYHVALAETIVTLLRSLPYHTSQRTNIIPNEIAADVSLVQEEFFRQGPNANGALEAIFTLHHLASTELEKARSTMSLKEKSDKLDPALTPLFLSATPSRSYLDLLEKSDFNAFDANLQKRFWKFPFQLMYDNMKKRF